MKQLSTEKYNVAWFKLAEFVSRGEKERALAMYRLLAHSIEDRAFVKQLEGDLLLAFNDDTSFERYADAVTCYAKELRVVEACSVFEHMMMLEPHSTAHINRLMELHKKLEKEPRVIQATQHLMRWLMNKKEFDKVSLMLQKVDQSSDAAFNTIHQELVQNWLKVENPPTDPILMHIKKTIDYHFSAKQQKSLQTFLMTIKMMHNMLYQEACLYMQDGSIK